MIALNLGRKDHVCRTGRVKFTDESGTTKYCVRCRGAAKAAKRAKWLERRRKNAAR